MDLRLVLAGLCLSAALSGLLSPIGDCDEVYNYWEPLHFLEFGAGFQTWEYAPQYALRSYSYLLINGGWFLHLIQKTFPDIKSTQLFFIMRTVFFGTTFISSSYFFIASVHKRFGNSVAFPLAVAVIFSPASFISATTFLPQTFAMVLINFALGAWISGNFAGMIIALGIGGLLGWPFIAILTIVPAIDILLVKPRHLFKYFSIAVGVTIAILGVSIMIDYYFYNSFVVPVWNLIVYNRVLDSSGTGGADIYGVEPASFYPMNLFLNLNVAFILILFFPIILFLHYMWHRFVVKIQMSTASNYYFDRVKFSIGLFLWFVVFQSMRHKEERFLFPAYPYMFLVFAFTIGLTYEIAHTSKKSILRVLVKVLRRMTFLLFGILSISRITSQWINYSAPLQIFQRLHDELSISNKNTNVSHFEASTICIGKEWYRFPSSFFLPRLYVENVDSFSPVNADLLFLDSGFTGQLPKSFPRQRNATWIFSEDVNNKNLEEKSRYSSLDECDYLIDWSLDRKELLNLNRDEWITVLSVPFLNASLSKAPFRSFHAPFISSRYSVYQDYVLLKKVRDL